MTIAVAWKDVAGSTSAADRAALEVALRLAESFSPAHEVVVVTVGPAGAEPALRRALAAGATRSVRVGADADLPSAAVAAALAAPCAGSSWIVCGDVSTDRGSGSVPAFLAAELGLGQALGLVALDVIGPGSLRLTRRLDGGRRELLGATAATVLSVEGSVLVGARSGGAATAARLRRASLTAELAAGRAVIDVVPPPADRSATGEAPAAVGLRPYRPRPRHVPPPEGAPPARIAALTGGSTPVTAGRVTPVVLDPAAAAELLLDTLRCWGYL